MEAHPIKQILSIKPFLYGLLNGNGVIIDIIQHRKKLAVILISLYLQIILKNCQIIRGIRRKF